MDLKKPKKRVLDGNEPYISCRLSSTYAIAGYENYSA